MLELVGTADEEVGVADNGEETVVKADERVFVDETEPSEGLPYLYRVNLSGPPQNSVALPLQGILH